LPTKRWQRFLHAPLCTIASATSKTMSNECIYNKDFIGPNLNNNMKKESNFKFYLNIILLFIVAGYITYLFHEFGHWIIGEFLGNDMVYSLNGVWPRSGNYVNKSHGVYVLLGGPLFTILQSIVVLIIIEKFKTVYAYPFVFFPVFTRFFTLILGGFSKQDEAKISAALEIGTYTFAVIVLFILLIILLKSSFKLKIGLKFNSYFIAISTASLMLVIETYNLIWQ